MRARRACVSEVEISRFEKGREARETVSSICFFGFRTCAPLLRTKTDQGFGQKGVGTGTSFSRKASMDVPKKKAVATQSSFNKTAARVQEGSFCCWKKGWFQKVQRPDPAETRDPAPELMARASAHGLPQVTSKLWHSSGLLYRPPCEETEGKNHIPHLLGCEFWMGPGR